MTYQEKSSISDWNEDALQSLEKKEFFSNGIVRVLLSFNIVLLFLSFGLLGYFVRHEEGAVILHYNVYFGVDIQGVWWQVFLFPFAGLFFLVFHTFLAYHFYKKSERIASYLLLFGASLLSLGILIVCSSIALINY